jgi:hypothetical protein
MPETIREFVLGLTFGKPDEKNLDKATASAKKSAKEAEDAYKRAAKEVEKAQAAVRAASDKTAKQIARDALFAAQQQQKAAREASRTAVAELRKIEKASKDATRASDKALKDQNATIASLRGGIASIAAAAGIGGIGAITSSITEQATAVREWTARLGDAPDVLQRVAGAAKILGVEMEPTFKAIQKLRVGIGEGTADEPLAALGLKASDLAGMDAEGQLRAIANGLQTVATDAERTAIATRLFGEEGGKLVPVLAGGAAGFDELTRAAVDAGAVMSGETLKAAQDFDKALNTATLTAKGLAAEVAGNVLPRLGEFADDVGVVGEAMGILGDETEETSDEFGAAEVVTGVLGLAFLFLTTTLGALSVGFDLAADAANRYGLASSRLTGRVSSSTGAITAHARKQLAAAEKAEKEQAARGNTAAAFLGGGAAAAENKRAREGKKGGGKGKARPADFTAEDFEQLEAEDLIGQELDRIATQIGATAEQRQIALEAASQSIASHASPEVAMRAAQSSLESSTGRKAAGASKDPLLSAIFGDQVPDVELSKMALGATPQTLIATINNTFTMQFDTTIDGAGNPADVANEVHGSAKSNWEKGVAKTTKLVKPSFFR